MKAINGRGRLESNYLQYFIAGHKDNLLALGENRRSNCREHRLRTHGEHCRALPPLPTQRAIANFLDEKTATIDDLIAKKERLIELLEEKRAALINRAVTKGLDPDVPMKDSGIPWIGEIPEHWEVRSLRRLSASDVPSCTESTPRRGFRRRG